MKPPVKSVCKSAYFELHNINSVRNSLTKEAAATAIHAFITSRLDVCNSLLYGLPKVTFPRFKEFRILLLDVLLGQNDGNILHLY